MNDALNHGIAIAILVWLMGLVSLLVRLAAKRDGWIWALVDAWRDFLGGLRKALDTMAEVLERHERQSHEEHERQLQALGAIHDQLED